MLGFNSVSETPISTLPGSSGGAAATVYALLLLLLGVG